MCDLYSFSEISQDLISLGDVGDLFLRKVALRSGFASPEGLCVICILSLEISQDLISLGDVGDLFLRKVALTSGFASPRGLGDPSVLSGSLRTVQCLYGRAWLGTSLGGLCVTLTCLWKGLSVGDSEIPK